MISERLRKNYMPVIGGFGSWHIDPLSLEAADVIDALVAALEKAKPYVSAYEIERKSIFALEALRNVDAALALARRK